LKSCETIHHSLQQALKRDGYKRLSYIVFVAKLILYAILKKVWVSRNLI